MRLVTVMRRTRHAFAICSCMLLCNFLSAKQAASDCHRWLSRINRESEKIPMTQRYRAILKGIAKHAECIPEEMRTAAKQAAEAPDITVHSMLLYTSSRPYLQTDAVRSEMPSVGSSALAKECPLQGALSRFESMYDCIDEGTYAFVWVVQAKLIENGSYQNDEERMLMNFLLSWVKHACPEGRP